MYLRKKSEQYNRRSITYTKQALENIKIKKQQKKSENLGKIVNHHGFEEKRRNLRSGSFHCAFETWLAHHRSEFDQERISLGTFADK